MSILLEAEHLTKIFTQRGKNPFKAVNDVSFTLKKGETLGIVGESGSGKSTIAKLLTRLTDITEGTLKFEGKDITRLKQSQLKEVYGDIQMVFQNPVGSFDPRRTLGDGIGESLRNRGMKKADVEKRVAELLEQCGLEKEYAKRYPHEVSGGQCQRAAIARALAVKPKVLICDEATSALDVTIQKQIMELLEDLKEKNGLSFIFICHNLALVQMFCDRVLVLYEGKVVESGIPDDIINEPKEEYTQRLVDKIFMDLKQLQYFVVCAQTGSFSDAAKNLYSTQPSVSKVIKGLEDTLGMQLFERLPRGIRLTVQGHKMYEYASKIINEVNVLENMASSGMTKWIRISLNPSSWFANQFVDFYNETYEKKYHFQVTTAGVQSVMERVRDYMDDIGFVYILSQQKENFLYELSKNKMHFEPIYETDVMLYPGGLTELYNSGKERAELEDLEGIRFIQNYQDEFFDIGAVKEDAFQWKDIDISVLTNSDYIMEKMLKNSKVANISGSYLSENKEGTTPGIPLDLGDSKVIFGFILHKGEEMDESVAELVEFLKSRLPKH